MNSKIQKELQEYLHKKPLQSISPEHLADTVKHTSDALIQTNTRARISFPGFLLRLIPYTLRAIWPMLIYCAVLIVCFCSILPKEVFDSLHNRHLPMLLGFYSVLIAATSIPLLKRSIRYQMQEIETASRLSHSALFLGRIIITGVVSLIMILAIYIYMIVKSSLFAGSIFLFLIMPYLFVSLGLFSIYRHSKREHFTLMCGCFCSIVVGIISILDLKAPFLFSQAALWYWAVFSLLLIAALVLQIKNIMKTTNGVILWN